MAAPQEVVRLVETFRANEESYRRGQYNETQVRRDFIDPLFKALGWDIDNSNGYAEAYRDVIHEDSLKVEASTRAPDYSFRIGGVRKFFLEAKKPSTRIKDDPLPAYQLRRYGWSAKLELSILTDFQEFAVYDCRVKPSQTDKASVARVSYYTFDEYVTKWDEIASVFSKESVLKGSFDRFSTNAKRKRGTAEVDNAFLAEIDNWRQILATDIALRNHGLTDSQLNFAVQQTIDRIIFLRICEDRGIENYGRLQSLLKTAGTYEQLKQVFKQADGKYNSGLFHFKKERGRDSLHDDLTLNLVIDDKPLCTILKNIYYPESPYEFSVISADILGSVYERFLGKVITLSGRNVAKVEEKPEVKKAGGVYYTPSYIVDFIVASTLGKVLEGKSLKQAESVRILDPACGSGSFLIVAYQYLLDWHLAKYQENLLKFSKGKAARIRQGTSGEWRLTTSERKRILLDHVYGVDIDPQAVEVTKLSLLLKVLEGESSESITAQLKLFHDRALPDLEDNIKCGNSLVEFSYLEEFPATPLEQINALNLFDWTESFPAIFGAGGFDVVIGNPPYIFTRELITPDLRKYYSIRYKDSWEKQNTFLLFMQLLLRITSARALSGFIVPNSWLTMESAKLIRGLYTPRLIELVDCNFSVFADASLEPVIFISSGAVQSTDIAVSRATSKADFGQLSRTPISRRDATERGRLAFSESSAAESLLSRIESASDCIGDHYDVRTGLQAYEKGKGSPPQSARDVKNHVFDADRKLDSSTYRYLEGRDVQRNAISWSGSWLRWGPWLSQPRELAMFSRPRLLVREITSKPPYCIEACFSKDTFLNNKSILNVLHDDDDENELLLLLAILNSSLLSFYYRGRAVKGARKLFPKIVIRNLREFPFPKGLSAQSGERLATLAREALMCKERLSMARSPSEKNAAMRRSNSINSLIDSEVAALYGLGSSEIALLSS